MAYTLLGKDFTPPDVRAKVTGSAKYAEDFRAEGMVFCKLLLSPAPHARITNLDVSAALEMEGVLGILQASECGRPGAGGARADRRAAVRRAADLAVAAETETIASDALDAIRYDLEALPFTVDPLGSPVSGRSQRAGRRQCRDKSTTATPVSRPGTGRRRISPRGRR